MSNFLFFPEIQDGGRKEIMRGKFKIRFSSESHRFILAIMYFSDA